MNKAKLAGDVANQTGVTKKTFREAVEATVSAITGSLARKEKVTLVRFGTFQVAKRKARRGVNPQTKETIQMPAEKVPKLFHERV